MAYRERPDLRAMGAQVLAAAAMVRMQRSTFFRSFSLSSLMQFSNNPFNPLIGARAANQSADPFANITGSLFVGGTLSLNLFDTSTATPDCAMPSWNIAASSRKTAGSVGWWKRTCGRCSLACSAYTTRASHWLRSREIARDNLDISERRYKNGDIGLLDFIDAQVEATQLRDQPWPTLPRTLLRPGRAVPGNGRLPRRLAHRRQTLLILDDAPATTAAVEVAE